MYEIIVHSAALRKYPTTFIPGGFTTAKMQIDVDNLIRVHEVLWAALIAYRHCRVTGRWWLEDCCKICMPKADEERLFAKTLNLSLLESERLVKLTWNNTNGLYDLYHECRGNHKKFIDLDRFFWCRNSIGLSNQLRL